MAPRIHEWPCSVPTHSTSPSFSGNCVPLASPTFVPSMKNWAMPFALSAAATMWCHVPGAQSIGPVAIANQSPAKLLPFALPWPSLKKNTMQFVPARFWMPMRFRMLGVSW